MQVGEVRAAEDADFERLRTLCSSHDGWRMVRRPGDAVFLYLRDVSCVCFDKKTIRNESFETH